MVLWNQQDIDIPGVQVPAGGFLVNKSVDIPFVPWILWATLMGFEVQVKPPKSLVVFGRFVGDEILLPSYYVGIIS